MRKSRSIRLALVALLALATAIAVTLLARGDPDEAAASDDPHALVQVPGGKLDRILRAVDAVSAATPNADLVAEGRQLFRSSALAKQGEACQACHTEGAANPDQGTTPHPQGPTDFTGPRDPPALWGVARTAPYLWTGAVPTLNEMVTRTILNHFRAGASQPAAKTAEQTAAIVAYLETLEPPATAFDQGTLSVAALRGEEIFRAQGGCIACHGGPFFTDNAIHNTLVPQVTGGTDPGAAFPPGGFNTPQLRDLVNTAPYMHNGVEATLMDVVVFYDSQSSIANLRLTPQEMSDLVEYLKGL